MNQVDALKPYATEIVDLLLGLIRVENEDNAVLCMKTVMDLERHQTEATASRVQPFLDLIQEMFELMETVVRDTFDNPPQGNTTGNTPNHAQVFQSPRPGSPSTSVGAELGLDLQTNRQLLMGMQSFKVFAECPIIVVSLFQAHRNCVPANVKRFVPLIKVVLMLQAKPQKRAHEEAEKCGKKFTGVSKDIKNRAAFGEFITAQVKMMSFLAYLLRVYHHQLQDFLPTLPEIVVRLLRDCPSEKSATRKELLVAIRHTINFNFRKIFLEKIDDLLDDRTLIGDGLTVYETMRPLAYSLLADLIHHVRDSLSPDQIRRTVDVFSKSLHDNFPGTSFQTMSAKLLLNMADSIAKLPEKEDARHFLIMILSAIGHKFAAMNRQYKNAVKLSKQYDQLNAESASEDQLQDMKAPIDWDEIDIFTATPIKTSNPRDRGANPVEDNKFLFKNLLGGLKGMFYQLKVCNPEAPAIDPGNAPENWKEVSYGYNAEEVKVITKLFREGAYVFRYYSLEQPPTETNYSSPVEFLANHYMVQSGREEKELLEIFATVFHSIDPATFHEVFHSEIPHLYEMMFEHTALLHIPQFFLASEATSPSFAGMLLQFLMDHIKDVGSTNIRQSSILLRMFKLSFMAVTLFSATNEQVLLPHVTNIVTQSIQLSTTAEEPMNYFYLLRSLFRSIGGGRFELLYKEILPLLEMLLEVLNNLLLAARKTQERDLYVELCLTVPARLSNLLPHLSYLMRPLVIALRAGSELVGQGLRTLELCVDNLTAEYLDPIMAPVINELMTALWNHLRPSPYSHFFAHTTMRILGKLGGRNRKFLTGSPELSFRTFADDESSIDVKLVGSIREKPFPAYLGVDLAIAKLMETPKGMMLKKTDPFYKQQAFRLIRAQLKIHIGFESLPEDFPQLVRMHANSFLQERYDDASDILQLTEREKSIPKKDVQEEMLKKLLKALMLAAALPELTDAALPLLLEVCRHFTLVELGRALSHAKQGSKAFDVKSGEGLLFLDSRILAEAIAENLGSENPALRGSAERAMKAVFDSASTLLGSRDHLDKFPFFLHLAKVFCHKCHEEEWFTKAGGSLGIYLFVTEVDLGDRWMEERQIEFVRALIYVIKDMPQDLPANTRVQAMNTIEILLRRCNRGVLMDDLSSHSSRLSNLCGFLVYELAHMNKHVREAAQKSFSILAEVVGAEVHELLVPVKERLLQPIFNKPLRALPFATQIGYIEAITYCLSLERNLVEMNEPLNRLLMESLALADAEDDLLATKPGEYRTTQSIVSLRVSCIKLLSLAMGFSEFASQQHTQSRSRTISVFFKTLYSQSPEVIEAANSGLKAILLQRNKLPKDLLQSGLRPILMNLQDPKRLTVPGLDGLARLLTLLTTYFKVEIGDRLLMHIGTIGEISVLQKCSFALIEQNPQMKIIVATLNVFHLLPSTAVSFMENLINKVLYLESSLRRTRHSPFREPLLKYLNRYPKESWDFFLPKLSDMKYGGFFAQMVRSHRSSPLREVLIADIERLIHSSFDLDGGKKDPASINAIHIIHSITCHSSEWLVKTPSLRQALLSIGRELNRKKDLVQIERNLRLAADQAGEQVMEIFVAYLKHAPQDLDFLFQLIDAITADDIKPYPSVFAFIYDHVISSSSTEYWRSIIMRCLDLYAARGSSQNMKTFAFKNLVNPILAMDVMRSSSQVEKRFVDKSIVEAIHAKLWKPQLTDLSDDNGQPGVDHSRLELLQMSALLLKYHHHLVSDARKDIIKFGWSYIRLEDTINKHAAYVLIGFFIAQFDTPSKIVNQIYVALLKAHQNEGRALVIQALDLIARVLPKRLSGLGDSKYPMWAKWPKRILSEDSSNLQQISSIFQFMVRHPGLFYEAREHFIPHIIPSLSKIAQLPNPSNENKKLVLDLIHMIWEWEERRIRDVDHPPARPNDSPLARKRRLELSQTNSVSPASSLGPPASVEKNEYVIPTHLRMMLIKYLGQFISTLPERYPVPAVKLRDMTVQPPLPPNLMCRRSMGLFHDLLTPGHWADLEVDLFPRMTESILASDKTDKGDEKTATSIINTLQLLRIILNVKSDEWILTQLGQIQKLLEKCIRFENPEIQDSLHASDFELDGKRQVRPLARRILDALHHEAREEDEMEVETPSTEFVTFFSTAATETMTAGNLTASINAFWTLAQVRPSEIDQHIPQIMRALQQKLAKDQIQPQPAVSTTTSSQQGNRPPEGAQGALDAREMEISTQLILKTIQMISMRMATLGEQRRPFLSVLASLVERSQNMKLCEKILSMVETWVFNSNEPWPTLKEKTAVLHKMLLFEQRSDPTLLQKFLDLVIRIYEDPKITRTELTVRLEHAFLVGTRAQDVEIRNRFMNIFDQSLSKSANARLIYVLTSQNWDTLSDSFWLSQTIQLILGAIDMSTPLHLHVEDFKMIPLSQLFKNSGIESRKDEHIIDDEFHQLMASHKSFMADVGDVKSREVLEPLCQLQHTDPNVAYQVWVALFPLCWSVLSRDDRSELEKGIVTLLTKDYHSRQMGARPNVVQALLEGIIRARPKCKIPAHVLKFLSRTYDAWYTAAISLEDAAMNPVIDTTSVRESNLDALVEVYAGLQEDDFFYGIWRRRCKFVETNAALSYEQNGMWAEAQGLYENAQIKARTGAVPYSQGEYMLWEDHWVLCAQKLQQWDILYEFAKHENFSDLLLESAWRNIDNWSGQENMEQLSSVIKGVSDAPTPRRLFFQAFMSLLKFHEKTESAADFSRVCDEAIQLSIRKWHQLPKNITNAHIPILQNFQQLVELHDANVISSSLSQTTAANLDQKSSELKLLLGTWRDRLPNVWDDINAWQDLVTWRQHIFQLINRTYLALVPPSASNANVNSYAYRGYHETAWIINRFAHVARKHQLPEVCISQLSRIYTLPNIEIQEAFLKLREQAKCHYQNPTELNSGLDVINNTNLNYFGLQQKAEFFTLKGMFLAKLQHTDEANDAFGTALYYDIRLPKAWAEWGFYNDSMFKAEVLNMERGSAAVSCYLEAAGLFKNAKSRKLLSRVLWLLSIDNNENRLSKAFEEFKGETPVWYWITFIPQLLTSLSHREAKLSRAVLVKIAKLYPQSLYFLLRTSREDLLAIKKQQDLKQERLNRARQSPNVKQGSPENGLNPPSVRAGSSSRPGTASGEQLPNGTSTGANGQPKSEPNGDSQMTGEQAAEQPVVKKPWEYSDEIMGVLKTTFPLLALSMETMVDQIQKHFKCPPDEDAYRLIVALLNDGLAVSFFYINI
jgi:transformation/transcription domain-associated protein